MVKVEFKTGICEECGELSTMLVMGLCPKCRKNRR